MRPAGTSPGQAAGGPLLEVTGVSKSFPGVRALEAVSFEVRVGEVHALLGENGAGKSTLLKILSGAQTPDAGTIRLARDEVAFASPDAAQAAGIVTIYQEFSLFPSLTIAENVFVGREPRRFGLLDWAALKRATRAVIDEVGLDLDPMRLVADLSVAEQQMVEIARALSMESRLIIMDEPTSALSDKEVGRLFEIIRGLRARGIAIVFVTHRLEEVKVICDRLTVLRDGRLVGVRTVAETTVGQMIEMMVGREVERLFAHGEAHETGEIVLRVRGLTRRGRGAEAHLTDLHGIDLEVRAGEIVGLAGLIGAGRSELARAIFGADGFDSGSVEVAGRPLLARSPRDAIAAGIGLVPEDRKQQALFLALAIRANLSIAALKRVTGFAGWVDRGGERDLVERYRERLSIRMAGTEQEVQNLSGGNQQKVVLARWLALQPRLLIVDEPTRGIDVAAKAEVHGLLYELARAGIGVLAISSELPEILTISDRIVTMREGRITGETAAAEASEERLMALMTLAHAQAA